MNRHIARGLALLALFGALAGPARADEVGDQLKNLLDKVSPSIVTVKLVIKAEMSFMGQSRDQEQRSEVHGVVVDPEGLIMVSSTAIRTAGGPSPPAIASARAKIRPAASWASLPRAANPQSRIGPSGVMSADPAPARIPVPCPARSPAST